MDKVIREYSILGSALYDPYYVAHGAVQSAIVMTESYPFSRVFVGVGVGNSEDEIYSAVARLGDELSFDFIERLYLKMKEERECRQKK